MNSEAMPLCETCGINLDLHVCNCAQHRSKPMNSEALANRVVALGFGKRKPLSPYITFDGDDMGVTTFINDGRVVLAMMEKVRTRTGNLRKHESELLDVIRKSMAATYIDTYIAPAIIKACCDALEQANEQ